MLRKRYREGDNTQYPDDAVCHFRKIFKEKYEEKQRKELNNENHKILFFDEKFDKESGENYFVPNGKYWEMKKKGELKNNSNHDIKLNNYYLSYYTDHLQKEEKYHNYM